MSRGSFVGHALISRNDACCLARVPVLTSLTSHIDSTAKKRGGGEGGGQEFTTIILTVVFVMCILSVFLCVCLNLVNMAYLGSQEMMEIVQRDNETVKEHLSKVITVILRVSRNSFRK